ncbi:hypothetical protein M9H77_04282 [Catharanthus roseus]|uniref:Uncharacterized protein n=1 Tax=Catharanthus roseus TaxID=4058 RepID=A0ACC0CE37_CATRO|nr:hypothetical protein M9H77_04282 [Catharanthus roseus]
MESIGLDLDPNFTIKPYRRIPREIYNISSLEFLSFTNNSISDSLPNHICDSLPRLSWLLLGLNKFRGQIPSGNLSRYSELEFWKLVGNEFDGVIPKEIANLNKLQKLYLGNTILEDIHIYVLNCLV